MKVKVWTWRMPPEGWSLEVDVDRSTSVAAFKELLTKVPDAPQITQRTRLLQCDTAGHYFTLKDDEAIKKNMVLLDPTQEEQRKSVPQQAEQTSPQKPAAATQPSPTPPAVQADKPPQKPTAAAQPPPATPQAQAKKNAAQKPSSDNNITSSLMNVPWEEISSDLKGKLGKKLSARWPCSWQPNESSPVSTKRVQDMLQEQLQCLKPVLDGDAMHLTKLAITTFQGSADVLRFTDAGVPSLHQTVLEMSATIFKLFRPLLSKHGYEDSIAGLMQMDQHILAHFDHNHHVAELYTSHLHILHFGRPATKDSMSLEERFTAHYIWIGIVGPLVNTISTAYSYIHHLGMPPLERRLRSCARTIAFTEHFLVTKLVQTANSIKKHKKEESRFERRVFWILGGSEYEGHLARCGFFEDLTAFRAGGAYIVILSDVILAGTWPQGDVVKVYSATWAQVTELPEPSLVFNFNTGIGTFDRLCAHVWLPRIIGGLWGDPPPVAVLTCRCEEEARGEALILERLGVNLYIPKHVRNLYSAMAGNPDVEYDDYGWIIAYHGFKSDIKQLDHWLANPDDFLQEVRSTYGLPADDEKMKGEAETGQDAAELPSDAAPAATGLNPGASNISAHPAAVGSEDDGVAGEPGVPAEEAKRPTTKSSAVFWGILDLKYDFHRSVYDRVKVLETGDGRSSRFSGYGAAIKEKFQHDQRLEETIRRAVLTDNKKLTHDTVVECGYAHLRPRQVAFPRVYTEDLAWRIRCSLFLQDHDNCVLKLCNRARGAGVIPVRVADLDTVLKELLTPPSDVKAWLQEQPPDWFRTVQWGCFEEQVRHWWSNECPVFLAEEFCTSTPTTKDDRQYDGTMRVGFSLHRLDRDRLPPGWVQSPDGPVKMAGRGDEDVPDTGPTLRPWDDERGYLDLFRARSSVLRVEWLGGYWKLPIEDVQSADLRGKVVSVAKQGTAPVNTFILHDVYCSLGDMVGLLFNSPELSHTSISKKYIECPELGSFISSRLACSMRIRDKTRSQMVLQLAQTSLSKVSGTPKDCVESYIHRNFGVYQALHGNWRAAMQSFQKSLEHMPTNATSLFLLGHGHLESGDPNAAIAAMEESLLLDPDFKAPYANIGVAWLREGEFEKAAEVSAAGLIRHPNTPHCLYNLGVAKFALAYIAEHGDVDETALVESKEQDKPILSSGDCPPPAAATEDSKLQQIQPVGLLGIYRVSHERVMVRETPSTTARGLCVMHRGREISGVPHCVGARDEPWLKLGEAGCKAAGCKSKEAWVLIHGRSLGLGKLLSPDPSNPTEVKFVSVVGGGKLTIPLPLKSTVFEAKLALVKELKRGSNTQVGQVALARSREAPKMRDADQLAGVREVFVWGLSFTANDIPSLAALTEPVGAAGPGGRTTTPRISTLGVNRVGGSPAPELRAEALQHLSAAHDAKPNCQQWTQLDDEMLERLRSSTVPLAWPWPELPHDGWRIYNWRP